MRLVARHGLWVLAVLALMGAVPALAGPDLSQYEYPQTKALVEKVEQAAELISREGEAAFDQLRQPDSRWFKGENYVFVTGMNGVEVVNPAFPHLEGVNLMNWSDAYGKKPVKVYNEAVTADPNKPWAWVHYMWHRPGQLNLAWKTSYTRLVKSPSGKSYTVGSGLYDMRMERAFVIQRVNEAAQLVRQLGPASFNTIRARDGRFFFNDTYVFVDDADGVELVNPAFPGLEGRDLTRLNNPEGRPIVKEYIDLVKKKGKGWIGYYWPRPGEAKPSIKHTYVEGVTYDGKLYIVGCGAYLK